MATKTTLNARNLESLGAEKLAALLMEISTGSAAAKRRLRIALAGAQGGGEVAREVIKRLSSIERSRSFISWRRVKALKADLDTQRRVIVDTIAPNDPDEALDVMWRFMGLARSILARCEDGNGTILATFDAALDDLGVIANAARPDPVHLARRAFEALQDNDYGQYDRLIEVLAPALGPEGLARLKALVVELAANPVETPVEEERQVIGWGANGPLYIDELDRRRRNQSIRMALEQIADAEGDVDAFIAQQNETARSAPMVAVEIARRLLAAGRAPEAWDALAMFDPGGRLSAPYEWEATRIEVLEALGQKEVAQADRWRCFEQSLDARHLRAHLKRLPDFDDMEAEERALAHAGGFPDIHHALAFMVAWPALEQAARLVVARAGELDGDDYVLLTEAAAALAERHPLAATLLLRAMIDFALEKGRSSRYRHAARHLEECRALAGRIADFGGFPAHPVYERGLVQRHGKKSGFWKWVG
jgi:hypothetical protein